MNFKRFVVGTKNFPKPDVTFWDFTPLLDNVQARNMALCQMQNFLASHNVSKIAAIESKGFTIGSMLAERLSLPLVLIRKPNLIPTNFASQTFIKEYGVGEYQLKKDAVKPGDKVALVYDIMAGPGATNCGINLLMQLGASVEACVYVTELTYLKGREQIACKNLFSLVKIHDKSN